MSEQPSGIPAARYRLAPVPSQHLDESRRLIYKAGETVAPHRAVVLGAGNCVEIPLAELAARFDELLVNDMTESLLEHALDAAHLDAASRAKIRLDTSDLTGVTDPLLTKIDAALAAASDSASALEEMARLVDQQPIPGTALAGSYDLVVASCVLSQLHFALLHGAGQRFETRFPGQLETLRASVRWTKALYDVARRMEHRLVDDLARLVAPDGLIYFSESVQMCYIRLIAGDQWETEGTFRMLRTVDIADYLDSRFAAVARARWHWVVNPPEKVGDTGRLFDVQALVLRLAKPAGQGSP